MRTRIHLEQRKSLFDYLDILCGKILSPKAESRGCSQIFFADPDPHPYSVVTIVSILLQGRPGHLPEGAALQHDRAHQRGLCRLCEPLHQLGRAGQVHTQAQGAPPQASGFTFPAFT